MIDLNSLTTRKLKNLKQKEKREKSEKRSKPIAWKSVKEFLTD